MSPTGAASPISGDSRCSDISPACARSEANASMLPSGDQRGSASRPGPRVSCLGACPADASHRFACRPAGGSVQAAFSTLHATWRPSGETTTSVGRLRLSRASIVTGVVIGHPPRC